VLLRDSILDGMRDLLLTRDWSAITLADVARAAGISRQTIYNEFGSRQGLALGYAMRELLLTRDWSAITLSDVARTAGISRQTIYNEFGSRQGLAQGYALRLADRLVDAIHAALDANVGNFFEAFLAGFRSFFAQSASDPLVISLLSGVAKPDLLQLITVDSAPIITHCSQRLTTAFAESWVKHSEQDAGVLARAIVRLCMSYVSMPPEAGLGAPPASGGGDVAVDLARLMTPFAERYGVIERN